jgi:hypothetical protein
MGLDFGRKGLKDEEIVVLRRQRNSALFTRDAGFYQPVLRHPSYCIVVASVGQHQVAAFIRRFLRHPDFDTQAKRMGRVLRISLPDWRSGDCGHRPRCTRSGTGPSSVGRHYGGRRQNPAGYTANSVTAGFRRVWARLQTLSRLESFRLTIYRIPIYDKVVIESFRDAGTERIFQQQPSKQFRSIEKTALRSVSSSI